MWHTVSQGEPTPTCADTGAARGGIRGTSHPLLKVHNFTKNI